MAKRRFELPGIEDLSKEQDTAIALPKEGQYLIVGGPGTGKSVLALLRARRYQAEKDEYIFLVYNHLLHQASRQLAGIELISQTWVSWFMKQFHQLTSQLVPRIPSNKSFRDFDWERTEQVIAETEIDTSTPRPYLIIDEGQDMPTEFYSSLINMGFENFFVVADQNQQIVSGSNSSRYDIETTLGIEPQEVIELKENYRNRYPIARLAREFYTGDPASHPPELPSEELTSKRPLLFSYRAEQFYRIVIKILKMVDRTPNKLIAVITPNNRVRERYFKALIFTEVTLDNDRPTVSTYVTGADFQLSFDEGGIMVINAQSCKGLEFDFVFLADINEHQCHTGNSHNIKMTKCLFYVMVARAIDKIIMLRQIEKHCSVDMILPDDPLILERIN